MRMRDKLIPFPERRTSKDAYEPVARDDLMRAIGIYVSDVPIDIHLQRAKMTLDLLAEAIALRQGIGIHAATGIVKHLASEM